MSRLLRRSLSAAFVALVVAAAPAGLAVPPVGATPAQPNDPGFALQWNLDAIGAPAAWATSTGRGAVIAVVDSGIDLSHEDLAGKIVGHVTCVGSNGDPSRCAAGGDDDDGHGTHVAGIAAATTDNGIGVAGVAPDAGLLDVKALSEQCLPTCTASGSSDDVAAAIEYAADHGATVVNLSLGNAAQSVFGPAFSSAIEYAWGKGVISVVAAGNDFILPSGFGNEPAIVVGALDRAGTKASYGNDIGSAHWALMAPGGEADTAQTCEQQPQGVLSTYFHNGYACLAGTSMAAPHVSGAVALLRSMGLSPQQTVDRLLATARPLGSPTVYGAGALDVAAAVGAPGGSAAPAPAAEDTAPAGVTGGAPGKQSSDATAPSPATDPVVAAPGPAAAVALPPTPNGRVTARTPRQPGDGLPTGPVAVAVLLASSVACSSAWLLLRGARPVRRIPPG